MKDRSFRIWIWFHVVVVAARNRFVQTFWRSEFQCSSCSRNIFLISFFISVFIKIECSNHIFCSFLFQIEIELLDINMMTICLEMYPCNRKRREIKNLLTIWLFYNKKFWRTQEKERKKERKKGKKSVARSTHPSTFLARARFIHLQI